jgi:hypothetical protein
MTRLADLPAAAWLFAAVALAAAAVGARPYAGSWNDGSRLAAVESLLDRGTLAIDDSIFCRPPQHLIDAGLAPYPAGRTDLLTFGTLDKLFIHGHYHSDKPAVVSILMAALYQPLMGLGLPSPAERPDVFCWMMTVLTSGLGYAVAVGCLWALGTRLGLAPGWRLAWTASFALSTFALAYTRHVNSHIMMLGVVSAMCLLLVRLAGEARDGRAAPGLLAGLGTLAGLGFNLDFGSGPLLLAITFVLVAYRTRRLAPLLVFAIAALPWVAAAIGLNYAIGGGWKPINMYPEYFIYPGSPFTQQNLTGFFRHSPLDQFLYAGAMLIGKHGFWNHNLALLLAAAAGWRVLRSSRPPFSSASPSPRRGEGGERRSREPGEGRADRESRVPDRCLSPFPSPRRGEGGERRSREPGEGQGVCDSTGHAGRAELLGLLAWCTATWLLFAVLSNNMGGACCSVRWFVPFLAPAYWLLAILLRDRPEFRADFIVLSVWGAVLGGIMWWIGPWTQRMVPLMWPVVGGALLTWGAIEWSRRRRQALGEGTLPVDAVERQEQRRAA